MRRIAALLSLLIFGYNPTVPSYPTGYGYYPASAVIVDINYETDEVLVEDVNGFLYAFYGCEDYAEGDIVSLIMDSNGTPESVTDDRIIDAKYSGFTIHEER